MPRDKSKMSKAECEAMAEAMNLAISAVMDQHVSPERFDRKRAVEIGLACLTDALTTWVLGSAYAMSDVNPSDQERDVLGNKIGQLIEEFLERHCNQEKPSHAPEAGGVDRFLRAADPTHEGWRPDCN